MKFITLTENTFSILAADIRAVAVDYITGALYFADETYKLIGVIDRRLNFFTKVTLIKSGLRAPTSLAIDPISG